MYGVELIIIDDCGAFVSEIRLLISYEFFSNTSAEFAPYHIFDELENTTTTFAPCARFVFNRFNCKLIS